MDLDLNRNDLYLNHKCLKFKSLRFRAKSQYRLVPNHNRSGFILNPCNLECVLVSRPGRSSAELD